MFEVAGVSEEVAREALRLAMHKLPIKCKFVKKDGENVEKDLLENEQRRNILKAVKSLGEPDSSIIFLKFYFVLLAYDDMHIM